MTRQTLQLALSVLSESKDWLSPFCSNQVLEARHKKINAAITAIEQELAKSAQEPLAWAYVNTDGECEEITWGPVQGSADFLTLLYTSPPDQSAEIERLRDQVERLSLDLGLREGK